MKSLRSTSPLSCFVLPFVLAYLLLGFLTRVVIWIFFRTDSSISVEGLGAAVIAGVGNDCVTALYAFAPLIVLLLLFPKRLVSGRFGAPFLRVLTFVAVFIALFVSIAEVLFWEEFESRFNLIAVDYLVYPTEVIGNIRESYPVVPLLLLAALIAWLTWRFIWRTAYEGFLMASPPGGVAGSKFRSLALYSVMLAPLSVFYSADTLSFSNNRATNELAGNGLATFFRAVFTEEIDYHHFYKTLPGESAFATVRDYYKSLGETFVSTEPRSLVRSQPARSAGLGKLNVVVLVQESLGAQFVGAYGDTRGLTPHLDELSKQSLMFRHAYATGTRTVRGLEAMIASFPPIPSESIVKRKGGDNISNWGSVMRQNGYNTSFLYGGFGAFDHMNAFFQGNGFSIGDRLNIPSPRFSNIWGVSDEDLFRYAVAYFDDLQRRSADPFFSVVLSTSNHKPFTFREGVPGVPTSGGGREAGVRYADYAIAEFLKEARTRPWFDDTVFVIIADHDSRVYGRAYVPVEHYRIPVLIYSPKHITPEVSDKVFSSLDLAPTIMGLLGIGYAAPFYGVDVLKENIPAQRAVMFSHNHNIAWYEGARLTVLGLQKEARSFSYIDGKTTDAPLDEAGADLLAAHLQTAYELFKSRGY